MYDEILPNAKVLMTDVFGNYVIQKFFEVGTDEQVRGLAKTMEGNILALSMQMYGCRVSIQMGDVRLQSNAYWDFGPPEVVGPRRVADQTQVVQKALDRVDQEQKLSIIAELDGKIVACVKSSNANHVVQASLLVTVLLH